MPTSVSLDGIGLLTLEHGSGGRSLWQLGHPVASSMYDSPIEVNILLEGADQLDHLDLPMIAQVLENIDRHLAAGLRFVHTTMLTDPALFGLAAADLGPYRAIRAEDLPLADPQLTFYTGSGWFLLFRQGRFPICDPYGLGVAFDRHRPLSVQDLSDAEEID